MLFKKIGKIAKNIKIPKGKIFKRNRNRSGQRQFREKLLNKFDSKCALLGINSTLCDAAHILPYANCQNKKDKYNVNNGILLSATLHKAYDKNYFIINENTCKIEILYDNLKKDNIQELNEIGLEGFEGHYIEELDNPEGKNFLKKRNKLVT